MRIALLLAVLLLPAGLNADEGRWKALNDTVVPQLMKGALPQAEQSAREAAAMAEKVFGAAHVNTAASLGNLALVLRYQKRYEESEKQYRRALAIREKQLGPTHPNTALLMLNMADVVQSQKKYTEAEKLQRSVLAVFEKAHGDDVKTATALNNLGANLQLQARYKEAEPLLKRALEMKEKVLGTVNQSVAHTLGNLAEVYEALGRKVEADIYRRRASEILRQITQKA
jgi:tetratricopeptide (TPR) repeat protein